MTIPQLGNAFYFFFVINFIELFLDGLSLHCCVGFYLVVASGGYSLAAVHGLPIAVVSLVEHGLEGEQASVIAAQWLWYTDLAAPQHVGSSWVRD